MCSPPFEHSKRHTITNGANRKLVTDSGSGFATGRDGQDCSFHRDTLVPPPSFAAAAGGELVTLEVREDPEGRRTIQVTSA